jgi:23S rRNA U2552 (ribose-2'-O)-methylase RlmE/FtsJ
MEHVSENVHFHPYLPPQEPVVYELDPPPIRATPVTEEEQRLHAYRNRIRAYEPRMDQGKNWEYYKKIVNPFELVYTQKRYLHFPESICCLRPLSRSYFKMVEILDITGFWAGRTAPLASAHVCEGPGGFIEAFLEEAGKRGHQVREVTAMTLKSKRADIPGWRRASRFLQENPTVQIIYGFDDTGDIMRPENQHAFIDHATAMGGVDLYTADGGFDFSHDYMKQEQLAFPLLLASTKIGMEVLARGGVFVLKLFDFYQKATTDLIYLLSLHFEHWTLYKPGMSRPCNPEHYFIGKGFMGCSEQMKDILRLWCSQMDGGQEGAELVRSPYGAEFVRILEEIRARSFHMQTGYLQRVFDLIDQSDDEQIKEYLRKNERTSQEWCERFRVPMRRGRLMASTSVAASQTDPPVFCPPQSTPDVERSHPLPCGPASGASSESVPDPGGE